MTATAPSRPHPAPPPAPAPRRQPTMPSGSAVLTPAVAGLATVCAATSLTGVIQGLVWLGYIIVAAVLTGCTGLALRSLRLPSLTVTVAQLLVLLLLVTGAFTESGILGIVPGPAAFTELNDLLAIAFEQIRMGLPPVEATAPILCLVTIAIGFVAVLVDTLTVAAAAPAATGLILLCVYAVPSALASELLSAWTFVAGAASFAGLLAVDGSHRHRSWRNRAAPGTGASAGTTSTSIAVVAVALVAGLLAGSSVTVIGTEGSLPGSASEGQRAPGGLGVNPFTSLRGLLDQGNSVELFRVRGLGDDRRMLRAFTLDTFRPNQGWGLPDGPMPAGVPADGPLPPAPGDDLTGRSRQIRIEPVNWNDLWLPVYGAPRALHGTSDGWYYDFTSGAVFRERRQRPAPYVELASLREPSQAELRQARPGAAQVLPIYTDTTGIDPRVTELTRDLTQNKTNDFDRTEAIWRHFSAEHGFVYDTETAPASDADAVADFLFNGKRGFCEQFASSMALMLRSIGIPSRVAIGFTTGYDTGEYRSITSQDAHAWVEVYFGDLGWVSFDPTPLSDGRGYIPPYLRPGEDPDPPRAEDDVPEPPASPQSESGETSGSSEQAAGPSEARSPEAPSWSGWGGLAAGLAALVVTAAMLVLGRRLTARHRRQHRPAVPWLPVAAAALWVATLVMLGWWLHWAVAMVMLIVALAVAAPAAVRGMQRQRRLREIAAQRPNAAHAAWHELLAECADRGIHIPRSDTVRLAAQKVAQRHHLDERAKMDLRTVVSTVERSWYADSDTGPGTEFARAFEGLRESLHRSAPLSWRGRLLPRSVFRRGVRR